MFDFSHTCYECEKMRAPDRDRTDEVSKASPGNRAHIQLATANNLFLSSTQLAQHCPSATCSRFYEETEMQQQSVAPVTRVLENCWSREMAPIINIMWEISRHVGLTQMTPLDRMALLPEDQIEQRLLCWWMSSPSTEMMSGHQQNLNAGRTNTAQRHRPFTMQRD